MTRIVTDNFTAPGGGETSVYSQWGEVGSAVTINAGVSVSNEQAPDILLQWADDTETTEPIEADVFYVVADPNGKYRVEASNLTPFGTHVRVRVLAYDTDAYCHVNIDTV